MIKRTPFHDVIAYYCDNTSSEGIRGSLTKRVSNMLARYDVVVKFEKCYRAYKPGLNNISHGIRFETKMN